MDGPWYVNSGPHIEEVRKDIMHSSNIMKWVRLYTTENIYTIEEVGDWEIIKAGGKNLCYGSFRGYASFTRKEIINEIVSTLKKRKTAIETLNNSTILSNWINYKLYHPPIDNSRGLRYDSVKQNFQKHQNN